MAANSVTARRSTRTAKKPPEPASSPPKSNERNRLLRALPDEDYAALSRFLEPIEIKVGDVQAEQNKPFKHVLFVETGMVSIVNHIGKGMIEVGTVGNEGMAGLSVFLEDGVATSKTFVQVPGSAKQIASEDFVKVVEAHPAIRRLLNRYAHAFLTSVAQTAACNLTHQLQERCARWLLLTHDRMEGAGAFPLTHEFLSAMLGVRRSGVTVAAGALQDAGYIRYTRGNITITDRKGLEGAACECYEVVRAQFDRLLG
jgi:cAMP-binding proteins - catabolite gene activator and regulatory subunit of cAMP-dependent protein kinases